MTKTIQTFIILSFFLASVFGMDSILSNMKSRAYQEGREAGKQEAKEQVEWLRDAVKHWKKEAKILLAVVETSSTGKPRGDY